MVPPLEFISIAEESGLIREIGAWVFQRALSQMASWDRSEGSPRLRTLSVNFSAHQLDDPDDIAWIGAALRSRELDPGRIEVEVTESVAMADTLLTKESLQALRDQGVRVSIDDFGTGYSSLAYLHTLPVGTVKIDRTFIERLPTGSGPVVRAILDMSHAMGLRVVAEGVSSADLKSRASSMGCDLAQGFYWTKPLPAAEFAEWWGSWSGSPATQLESHRALTDVHLAK